MPDSAPALAPIWTTHKACPLCGHAAEQVIDDDDQDDYYHNYIRCSHSDCGLQGPVTETYGHPTSEDMDLLWEQWDTRVPDTSRITITIDGVAYELAPAGQTVSLKEWALKFPRVQTAVQAWQAANNLPTATPALDELIGWLNESRSKQIELRTALEKRARRVIDILKPAG